MSRREVLKFTGVDLVESIPAIFDEVTPAMNLIMRISSEQEKSEAPFRTVCGEIFRLKAECDG